MERMDVVEFEEDDVVNQVEMDTLVQEVVVLEEVKCCVVDVV